MSDFEREVELRNIKHYLARPGGTGEPQYENLEKLTEGEQTALGWMEYFFPKQSPPEVIERAVMLKATGPVRYVVPMRAAHSRRLCAAPVHTRM